MGEPTTAGKFQLEFFPEPLQELRKEIMYHPPLLKLLHDQPDKDVYMQICEIAAYCDMILAGDYTRDDIIELCEKMVWKLKSKRSVIVLPVQ